MALEPETAGAAEKGSPTPQARRLRFRGLFERKERWGLTLRAWLLLGATAIVCVIGFARGIYPFLAVNKPLATDILVIEGWMPDYTAPKCVEIYRAGGYHKLIAVGGPTRGTVSPAHLSDTHAAVAAERFERLGIAPSEIYMAPNHVSDRDRTYASAIALKKWFEDRAMFPARINVVTLGPHSRRSRMLFQRALGSGIQVGVITLPNPEYDARHWWRFSEGIKEIISETGTYLYAKFLFKPDSSS